MGKTYIVQESTGFCLQDPDFHVYETKNPERRLKQLFLQLLSDNGFDEEYIKNAKAEINEDGYFEDNDGKAYFNSSTAWVKTEDIYSSVIHLDIADRKRW